MEAQVNYRGSGYGRESDRRYRRNSVEWAMVQFERFEQALAAERRRANWATLCAAGCFLYALCERFK